MAEATISDPVQFLDLLLDYFADGSGWARGDLEDCHGRRCLVGAIHYLRCKHQVPSAAVETVLQQALPAGHCHLALFNDRCADLAELRALILRARSLAAVAAADPPKRPATAPPWRWRMLMSCKRRRTVPAAASGERPASEPKRLAA
jgi:hypothetical protein